MATIKFKGFQLRVPTEKGGTYEAFGDAPKKVNDFVKIMNTKDVIVKPELVANMVAQDVGENFTEIVKD